MTGVLEFRGRSQTARALFCLFFEVRTYPPRKYAHLIKSTYVPPVRARAFFSPRFQTYKSCHLVTLIHSCNHPFVMMNVYFLDSYSFSTYSGSIISNANIVVISTFYDTISFVILIYSHFLQNQYCSQFNKNPLINLNKNAHI